MQITRLIPESLAQKYAQLSIAQRRIAGLACGLFLVLLVSLVIHQQSGTRYVPLSLGKQFSPEEMSQVSATLSQHQLHDFRIDRDRLLVPEDRLTEYDSALLESRQLPSDWAADWEQKYEAINPFTSSRKLNMMKEISLAKELKRIIQGLDGVEEASVVWADSQVRSFHERGHRVTATVNLRSKVDAPLSEQTIRAIQFSVAHMVPDLAPENVIVFDSSTGRHYQMHPQQAAFETEFDSWFDRELSGWQHRLDHLVAQNWPEAKLELIVDPSQVRAFAWREAYRAAEELRRAQPLPHQVANENATSVSFEQIRSPLTSRFPDFFQMKVTHPTPAKSISPDEQPLPGRDQLTAWIVRELKSVLPLSVPDRAIEVSFAPLHNQAPSQSRVVPTSQTNWQPLFIVICATIGLFLVARAVRRSQHNSTTEEDFAESELVPAPVNATSPEPSRTTPLGDPELVASVLKNWLDTAGKPDE